MDGKPNMEALILTCGTGGGHNAAARALAEELKSRGDGAAILNPYTLVSDRLARIVDEAYITAARDTPRLFGSVYKLGDWYRRLPGRSPVYFANRSMAEAMERYLNEHPADVIFTTHLYGGEILTAMKAAGMPLPPTVFIATDYVCIPFTEETDLDAYVIPTQDKAEDFINRGIPAEKLHPLGIPTAHAFARPIPKAEARASLGLNPEKSYILVAGGSMGGGKIESAVAELVTAFRGKREILVICGSNQGFYNRLKETYGNEITVLGQTNQMASYLYACDLYVTKPGGLSSTEAAVAEIPIFHTCQIPGCETSNARYFSQTGMSLFAPVNSESLEKAKALLEKPQALSAMALAQRTHISKHASQDICSLAESMITNRRPSN